MVEVILTGGSGFIGREVAKLLAVSGVDFLNVDLKAGLDLETCDLPDCQTIIHLAANPDVSQCENDPAENWRSNVLLTRRVVNHANRVKAAVIFASSAAVYGDGSGVPLGNYGLAKLASESLTQQVERGFFNLRFFNVYGPEQETGLMGAINREKARGGFLRVNGDGFQTRDFIRVETVAKAIVKATGMVHLGGPLGKPRNYQKTFDIATGEAETVNAFVSRVAPGLGVTHTPANGFEIRDSVGNPTVAKCLGILR